MIDVQFDGNVVPCDHSIDHIHAELIEFISRPGISLIVLLLDLGQVDRTVIGFEQVFELQGEENKEGSRLSSNED